MIIVPNICITLTVSPRSIIPDSKTNTGSRTDTIAAFSELIYFNPFNNNNIGKAVQIIAIKVIFNQLFLSGITKLPSKHATIKHAMLQPINTIEVEIRGETLLFLLATT